MKVNDEITASAISNVPMATTEAPDTTAPSAITDLRGGPPVNIALIPAPVFDASSEKTPKERATDGDLTTHWAAVNKAVDGGEWITVDTLASRLISRVRLRSPSSTIYFSGRCRDSGQRRRGRLHYHRAVCRVPNTKSTWHTLDFTPAMGRYVRVNITKLRFNTTYRAHIAEIEAYEATFTAGDITLSWTATGDDLEVGQASLYDLRWSNVAGALESDFLGQPSLLTDPPAPAETPETTDPIVGLPAGTLYFAIKARDEVPGQFSGISNVLTVINP